MSKFTEFYSKANENVEIKKKLDDILNNDDIMSVGDDQILAIGELATELGFNISFDEAKEYLNSENTEIDDDDLEAVAGGKGTHETKTIYVRDDGALMNENGQVIG